MYTDDSESQSCSECKMEMIEKRWTKVLLTWLNNCVHPNSPVVKELNARSIVETIIKYKQDIRVDKIDPDMLCCDDIEVFIRTKYPLLQLRHFSYKNEVSKKMYLLNSILLYHCCISSKNGLVDSDICVNLSIIEQETILKFCEKLSKMEITAHNIELAIKDACKSVKQRSKKADRDQKPSKIKSDSSRPSSALFTSTEMTASSSVGYMVTDTSSTNSVVTLVSSKVTVKKKFNAKPNLPAKKPPFITKFEIKAVKSTTPCSSLDKSFYSSKAIINSPKRSRKKNLDTTFKSNSKCEEKPRKSCLKQTFIAPNFESSITVLPSAVVTVSSFSGIDGVEYSDSTTGMNNSAEMTIDKPPVEDIENEKPYVKSDASRYKDRRVFKKRGLRLTKQACGDAGYSVSDMDSDDTMRFKSDKKKEEDEDEDIDNKDNIEEDKEDKEIIEDKKEEIKKVTNNNRFSWLSKKSVNVTLVLLLIIAGIALFFWRYHNSSLKLSVEHKVDEIKFRLRKEAPAARMFQLNSYTCKAGICEKVDSITSEFIYPSLSRCILLCMGPQVWPHPIGYTHYSKRIAVVATSELEYKFIDVPSEAVHTYLAEAFKFFLGELAKLEKFTLNIKRTNISGDSKIKKMVIKMHVETDPNPRINLETDESYTIEAETETNQVMIKLFSASFCGMRHALETLSQLILLDQFSGNLITLTNMVIKDGPSYKYRGLMIDTGRNYIPVPDIMRTIDAMASVKLNTFHWRISDVTSFPLQLTVVPQLFEYGSYSRTLVYTKDDVKKIVRRAGIRGIRVLLEVAIPGPVGRAWSWMPEAICPSKDKNSTCDNVLCLRLGTKDTVFDILQIIYREILEMTTVDDIFHLSDSVFSLINCFYLMEDREGFLRKALERLKMANKGILPKLPIVWYTTHLMRKVEARTWDRFGVQLTKWQPNPSEQFLTRFKVIHSSKWDLSCEFVKQRCKKYRTWQDMYSWKSWRTLDVLTIVGGEAILWTDMVDTGNIDYHLWPRTAAVAERLWSDVAINGTVTSPVYVRLDSQRWRMVLKSVQVQPIWPLYCSFSPGVCLQKIKNR